MRTHNKQHGFSLLELMIVITIIGILSATAIPSYQRYLDKARFIEIITLANAFKIAISLALQEGYEQQELTTGTHGIPPSPDPTANLDQLTINEGIIVATSSSKIHHLTYILTPNNDGSKWQVSGTCLQAGLCHE